MIFNDTAGHITGALVNYKSIMKRQLILTTAPSQAHLQGTQSRHTEANLIDDHRCASRFYCCWLIVLLHFSERFSVMHFIISPTQKIFFSGMAILNMVIQQGLLGMYFFNGRSFIIKCGNIFS